MYKDLDEFITEYQHTADFWYDVGCVMASEKLSKFGSEDWQELSSIVHNRPLEWQKKLAYCLDTSCNMYELEILLSLLNTEDEELFEICIDTLRSFTTQESKQMILDNPSILNRVNDLLPKAGIVSKKMLEDFLKKLNA
ncbi:hypothetical protein HPL003_22585 [Paenibacillus terrae HPL-003]|uniref:Immunity protein 30 domain-containing protein n=1 Tax=Paenibacillus terrae (strain HPL-003) TaxID=985665 RepID=G7VQY2_PAETH|nr:hypothetical protein [Paenibacillus terrae]AET61241.1 hypothetical protein HPL003_22585 [Paenibacillus terrae HPL-003]